MPVFPDRRMFRIHDPEVHPDAPGGLLPPVGSLLSASREQMWVGSLQQDIDVRLVLEEWDGQPLLPDAWEEEGKARLYLRGQISVDMGSAGTAVRRRRKLRGPGLRALPRSGRSHVRGPVQPAPRSAQRRFPAREAQAGGS